MKILVLAKPTFDTTLLRIDAKRNEIITKGVPYHINDHDKYALEVASLIKQKFPNTQIIAVGIGDKESKDSMREAIVRGADEVYFIEKIHNIKYEPFIYAHMLAEVVKKLNPNLILCGTLSEDYASSATHIFLSEILEWPIITNVINVAEISSNYVILDRKRENIIETLELQLPSIICVTSGIITLKAVTPIQIMRIPRDKIKTFDQIKLNIDNTMDVLSLIPIQSTQRKRILIDGEKNIDEAVKLLIDNLTREGLL
jgi:Electron transfer flavoprotein, beta subunit